MSRPDLDNIDFGADAKLKNNEKPEFDIDSTETFSFYCRTMPTRYRERFKKQQAEGKIASHMNFTDFVRDSIEKALKESE